MSTHSSRASLFGGALLAAGLTGTASAQFQSITTANEDFFGNLNPGGFAYAYNYTGGAYSYGLTAAAGEDSFTALAGNGSATATHTSSLIGGFISNPDSDTFAEFDLVVSFTMGAVSDVTAAWDVENNNVISVQVFDLVNTTTGSTVFSFSPVNGPFSGTQALSLTAGDSYTATLQLAGFQDFPGDSFFSLTAVPTPGTLALLPLGGLLASRRRRT